MQYLLMATITHCTTCFKPLALLIARRGRRTRNTRRLFNQEIFSELWIIKKEHHLKFGRKFDRIFYNNYFDKSFMCKIQNNVSYCYLILI